MSSLVLGYMLCIIYVDIDISHWFGLANFAVGIATTDCGMFDWMYCVIMTIMVVYLL